MKLLYVSVVLVYIAVVSTTAEDGDTKGPVVKVLDNVNKVVSKGAQKVHSVAENVDVRVENYINPEPHEPGQRNIFSSAIRGVGRLLRNATVEAGSLLKKVGKGTFEFTKHTGGAVVQTLRDSAHRIANPRKMQEQQYDVETVTEATPAEATDSSEADAAPAAEDAQAPAELNNKEASS